MMTFDDYNLKIWNIELESPALDVLLNSEGLNTDVLITRNELRRHCNFRTMPGCSKHPVSAFTTNYSRSKLNRRTA
uniref:Uncharacterized protein n=1 Tax=Arundo donax TaxID=35708 RepID=A0A0A9DNF1_ARUDO